jgi:hypothetical protein
MFSYSYNQRNDLFIAVLVETKKISAEGIDVYLIKRFLYFF